MVVVTLNDHPNNGAIFDQKNPAVNVCGTWGCCLHSFGTFCLLKNPIGGLEDIRVGALHAHLAAVVKMAGLVQDKVRAVSVLRQKVVQRFPRVDVGFQSLRRGLEDMLHPVADLVVDTYQHVVLV